MLLRTMAGEFILAHKEEQVAKDYPMAILIDSQSKRGVIR